MEKQSSVIFELDNWKDEAWLQKRENFDVHTVVKGLIFASLKCKSGNTVKSTKSNLKEEELEGSCLQMFFEIGVFKNFKLQIS